MNPAPPIRAILPETERVHRYDQVWNFRDCGGYRLQGGGYLRAGRLYRSAHHAHASDADIERIGKVGIAAIVDLRGANERAALPSRRPPDCSARIYEVEEETGGLLGPLVAEARARPGGFDAVWLMREGYATMPFRRRMRGILRNYFDALAHVDGPVLVHCMAGKDRTGLAVALLHSLLGLHPDDVMDDFLLTNRAGNPDLKGPRGSSIRVTFGQDLTDEQVAALASVRPEYLEAALGAVNERHGSTTAFLTQALDIPPAWLDAIRERLVE